jgi:hypothetical protein
LQQVSIIIPLYRKQLGGYEKDGFNEIRRCENFYKTGLNQKINNINVNQSINK